jgi:hypothetical protein
MSFNEDDIINIVIAGTAGQGVITLKRLIEFAAQKAGIERILGSETFCLLQANAHHAWTRSARGSNYESYSVSKKDLRK